MHTTILKEDYDETNPPLSSDGEDFRLILVGPKSILFGDGFGDLVDAIFEGEYEDLTLEEKLEKRHDLAVTAATGVQATMISELDAREDVDFSISDLDEQELNLILNSKDEPFPYDREEWNAPATKEITVHLFLVATMYAPFTEVERPQGEYVVWLDPTTEENLIRSLASAELVELHEKA